MRQKRRSKVVPLTGASNQFTLILPLKFTPRQSTNTGQVRGSCGGNDLLRPRWLTWTFGFALIKPHNTHTHAQTLPNDDALFALFSRTLPVAGYHSCLHLLSVICTRTLVVLKACPLTWDLLNNSQRVELRNIMTQGREISRPCEGGGGENIWMLISIADSFYLPAASWVMHCFLLAQFSNFCSLFRAPYPAAATRGAVGRNKVRSVKVPATTLVSRWLQVVAAFKYTRVEWFLCF